uniref:Uncharacterized protein n=1 Tax=Plectus sambesii TaxID=2011161 RepID=A0A914UM79_9BILA
MGCSCSKQRKDEYAVGDHHLEGPRGTTAYLGLAMLQANRAAAVMVGGMPTADLTADTARRLILKAKNDGCTVTMIGDSLYVDYKFVGYLPPGVAP